MRQEFTDRLPEAAERFGTPLYAYDWLEVEERWQALSAAFGEARVLYAMKANPNLGLLKLMNALLGSGFEAVSGGELERALAAGAPGERVALNGPGKLPADYARAREVGATV
ncbi:MAG TPA: diaminopimelate decarboxylase, partial [Deinococcales bacterium]|nr:diaminopimelate decarboxylase [Deinococcales bacterium]